jgi:hypothetical protein
MPPCYLAKHTPAACVAQDSAEYVRSYNEAMAAVEQAAVRITSASGPLKQHGSVALVPFFLLLAGFETFNSELS